MEWIDIHKEDDLRKIKPSKEQTMFIVLAQIIEKQKETLTLLILLANNSDIDKAYDLLNSFDRPSKLAERLSQWVDYEIASKIIVTYALTTKEELAMTEGFISNS